MTAVPLVLHCLLGMLTLADSARILAFFTFPAPSHNFIYRGVMEELARRGHQLLYVTYIPYDRPPEGIEQIDLSEYSPPNRKGELSFKNVGELSLPSYLLGMSGLTAKVASVLGTKEVQGLIHSDQRFDAVLLESYLQAEYLAAFIHKFNAVGIEVMTAGDSAWLNEMGCLPDNPAFQVDYKSEVPNDMTFWQRLYNTYVTSLVTLGRYYYLYKKQAVMDQYFNYTGWEERPPIDVLARNRSLILVNAHHALNSPYPSPPHRKDIGGIHLKPNKPLPQELQKYMDDSTDGVIFMSLGSHMKTSDIAEELRIFIDVFKDLPQKVMLKYEEDFTGDLPANVKLSKWFPQQDILAHENCVLFITHGGFLSITEAVYFGVPLIGIPFFADQAKNVIFAESQGFGRVLRYKNVSHETVLWTVREVLTNTRYKEEAVRRSKILKDRRHTPAEEAAYWIEHSLKYPFALTPKAANLSAIQLHMIDVKLFIVSVLIIIVFSFGKLISSLIKLVIKRKYKKKVKRN